MRPRKHRWAVVSLLLAAGLAAAPWWLSGPRFGAVVEWAMPDSAGRVHVAGGSWSWADVGAGLCGRPVSFLLEGVRVEDASGHELLASPPETTLESEGAVPFFAESGGGPLRLGPGRFVGPVGSC